MNKGTRNLLEAKLKKMLNHFEQDEAKKKQPKALSSSNGNIIRRRAGENEKRFSNVSTCLYSEISG